MATIKFGAGSFKNELWLKQKSLFKAPISVDVEFMSLGSFDWLFADATGNVVKSQPYSSGHGGWTSIHLPSLGLYGDFSIGFKNTSPGEKSIKQGEITLKD
ncbi:hypothetical protein [Rhizobium leguminosarum]|uniref:hypothetical protein n=1 Tax=Rhizobium leguminosarum TaxID=384 RepID=UPI003F9C5B2B